jgi:hypothetical protein
MKRLILLVGLCAGLLATTQALASDAPPGSGGAVAGVSGKRALNDFAVHFHVKYDNHGRPAKVTKFIYGDEDAVTQEEQAAADVPMNCTSGGNALTYTTKDAPWGPMNVNDKHKFKGHFTGNGGTGTDNIEVVITGEFTHHNHKADGTLHHHGRLPAGLRRLRLERPDLEGRPGEQARLVGAMVELATHCVAFSTIGSL